jgi:hypothetical protein
MPGPVRWLHAFIDGPAWTRPSSIGWCTVVSALCSCSSRLDRDDGGTRARAHLDLSSDDLSAEVSRLEALGARVLRPGDGFIVLRDLVALPFCVTGNAPGR